MHVLELLLSLLDNEGNDHTWDKRKRDRDKNTEVESLPAVNSRFKDVEDRERNCPDLKIYILVHILED